MHCFNLQLCDYVSERYFKIVHSILHRQYFRDWMLYAAIIITWINPAVINLFWLWTLRLAGGWRDQTCMSLQMTIYPSRQFEVFNGILVLMLEYVVPIGLFIYCYGHIIHVIKKRNKIKIEDHTQSSAQAKSSRKQSNVVKTMIIVCVAYFVCLGPSQILFFSITFHHEEINMVAHSAVSFFVYLNISLNPFLYATNHDEVRKAFSKKLHFRKADEVTTTIQVQSSFQS